MAYTTIDNPELYFQTVLYTGTGSTRTVTLSADTDMQPDVVWIKKRASAYNHNLFDSVRGVNKGMYVNNDAAEHDSNADGYLSAFSSDGFEVRAGSSTSDYVNVSSETYVAWCWKESATAGFDMVTYTGNETNRTISHSLSAVPHFMTIRNRTATNDWLTYHHKNTSAPETDYLYLNLTNATADQAIHWNDTAPTSSVFSVGTGGYTNGDTDAHIAYLWTAKQGFSKFGSYSGSGSSDGPFIYTGFRPAWIMCKCNSAGSSEWRIWNNKMDTFNPADNVLDASDNGAEDTSAEDCDFLANGFKWRAGGLKNNDAGETYIYMAFAEAPFVNSNGVPCNAR